MLLNFKKDTDVYFMIMEKIDNTFHDLCSNLETENFHLSADMLNYFTSLPFINQHIRSNS